MIKKEFYKKCQELYKQYLIYFKNFPVDVKMTIGKYISNKMCELIDYSAKIYFVSGYYTDKIYLLLKEIEFNIRELKIIKVIYTKQQSCLSKILNELSTAIKS